MLPDQEEYTEFDIVGFIVFVLLMIAFIGLSVCNMLYKGWRSIAVIALLFTGFFALL